MNAYKWLKTNEMVRRFADNANIPCAPGNSDFKQFQEYVAGGGQVDAADPPASKDTRPTLEDRVTELERKLNERV